MQSPALSVSKARIVHESPCPAHLGEAVLASTPRAQPRTFRQGVRVTKKVNSKAERMGATCATITISSPPSIGIMRYCGSEPIKEPNHGARVRYIAGLVHPVTKGGGFLWMVSSRTTMPIRRRAARSGCMCGRDTMQDELSTSTSEWESSAWRRHSHTFGGQRKDPK